MAETQMILNPQVANSIYQAWKADQEHPYKDRPKKEYPDKQRLTEVIDVAFRSSLLNEEGKPIRGSLVMLSPEELAADEIPVRRSSELVLRFNEPRPFDVDVVSKLALATSPCTSSLLIHWVDGDCQVWGIIYYSRSLPPLADIPVSFDNFRHFAPDAPFIEITGTGSLRITRADSVIGRVERGEFREALPTPFASAAMGNYLFKLFEVSTKDGKYVSQHDIHKGHLVLRCLEYLISKLDEQGGGATIIFVHRNVSDVSDFAKFPWGCDGGMELDALLKERIKYSEAKGHGVISSKLKLDEILRQRLDNLVQLASLDGALLLTSDFNIIGFGAKLNAPACTDKVLEGPDGFNANGDELDFSRLGTRHNSALNFVASVTSAIAFVASEDGPIRGLLKVTTGDVICWSDCRVSMFAS